MPRPTARPPRTALQLALLLAAAAPLTAQQVRIVPLPRAAAGAQRVPATPPPAAQPERAAVPTAAAIEAPKVLASELAAAADALIAAAAREELSVDARAALIAAGADELYRDAAALHGDLSLLLAHVDAAVEAAEADSLAAREGRRLVAHLRWRFGDLEDALKAIEPLAERASDVAARLVRARLLDALGRSKAALAAYTDLVPRVADPELAERLRLRMALMAMESGDEAQKDALATFAREPERSTALRNRAAIVLGLLDRPGAAADLYALDPDGAAPGASGTSDAPDDAKGDVEGDAAEPEATGDSATRERRDQAAGALRIAEWALAAKDAPRAQEAAWRAAELAPVARERRYALTLLAEAHRLDRSLPALLSRFEAEQTRLSPEARRVWIELLRETGSFDAAIALSQRGDAFSRDETRRLIELFRDAGREDLLLDAYAECLAAEPLELTWREGLARHHLERGDRAAAVALFEDWFQRADEAQGLATLPAARALATLGLDELAERGARLSFERGVEPEAALLFLFELHLDRGRLADARATLDELDRHAAPGAPVRMQLSDGAERLGDLPRALAALEGVKAARATGETGEDLELRLGWLYSEVGREEDALALWRQLWTRVKSEARLRFVEDRLMTVASRLGVLADVAVELEQKLFAGQADQKDSGLLVRLYTKVGDAVSAAEVIDEFLRHTGGTELDALTEKARIYLACNDYYHYERAVSRLIALDPAGRPDYLRQLAMSQLERGKPDEARATLLSLQQVEGGAGDDSSAEFEAGVLALSGLREEAIAAYRRGLAAHPERIDSYLLMANLMKEVRQSDRAVGMFQYLAETADGDDAFTIAIDGLLNMVVDAPPRPKTMEWARRITLERLAGRADAPYLYQLLADLAEETGDEAGQVRALEASLASSGPRRASVLRELMDLSRPAARSFADDGRKGNPERRLAYGRRLVGLGELVPPEVFLDLGEAFLEAGDERSAARTFDLVREFPDGDLYQRQAAERFEKANFVERALERYRAVLATTPTDVPLLLKVGELAELLGGDGEAHGLYRRAYDVLVRRKATTRTVKEDDAAAKAPAYFARNVDDFEQHFPRVAEGLLSTAASNDAVEGLVRGELDALAAEQREWEAAREAGAAAPRLVEHPRAQARLGFVRQAAAALGLSEELRAADRWLLAAFPSDDSSLGAAVSEHVKSGRFVLARELIAASGRTGAARQALVTRLGDSEFVGADAEGRGPLPLAEAVAALVPAVVAGDLEQLRALVQRADLSSVPKEELGRVGSLFAAARFLGEPELALRVGRDWVRLALGHGTYPYQLEQLVESVLLALDQETGLALARYVVGRIIEDPEKGAQFVTLLPTLARRFAEPVVDSEQVRTILDGFGEKYAWGLGPVLALIPPNERAGAVRSVWGKLEAANRADFLLDLVTEADSDVPEELGAFIRESLPAALREADDFVQYTIAQLVDVEHSHALILALAGDIAAVRSDMPILPAVRAIHAHALGEPDALERGAAVWIELLGAPEDDYPQRRAREVLQARLLPAGRAAFEAALSAHIAERGDSALLAKARADLAIAADDLAAAAVILREAAAGYPEETSIREKLRSVLLERGERLAAARVLEELLAAAKDDSEKKRLARTLAAEWRALFAEDRALAVEQLVTEDGPAAPEIPGLPAGFILPAGAVIVVNGVQYSGDDVATAKRKGPPKTFDEARKAFEDGRASEGALVLRRLWRQFPVGNPAARPSFGRRYRALPLATVTWPEGDAASKTRATVTPNPGGYLGYEPAAPPPRPVPPKAHARLASLPEARAELQRFLCTVAPFELDRLQDLLEGLVAADVAERGAEVVLGDLLERLADGRGGRREQVQLLALLDRAPELEDPRLAPALVDLVRTIPPRDAAQVRRLARVVLRAYRTDEALRLYRWCALLGTAQGLRVGDDDGEVVTTVTDRELVKEAREQLSGPAQLALIELVLDAARPVGNPWTRESYEQLVLDTWSELLPPLEALARARAICDGARDTAGTGLRRAVARRAAGVYLAAGELDAALEALEVGLARLDPARVRQPDERWFRADPKVPERLALPDLRRLFPPPGSAGPVLSPEQHREWTARAAEALEGWLAAGRVDAAGTVEALALAAVRLAELGDPERARALLERTAGRNDLEVGALHWLIDARRAVGDEAGARSLERQLLAEARLQPVRIADVVGWVLDTEGAPAARALAARFEPVVKDPRLVAVLERAGT